MTTAKPERNAPIVGVEATRPDVVRRTPSETDRPTSSDTAVQHGVPTPHNNLSLPRSPLIGRDHELATVQQLLLQEQVGLLTLTGPGGIGKTRLAMQVAANLLDHFVDGVYFVSLAPIRDPNLVIAAIAQPLGVREAGTRSLLESLQDALRDRQLLLVLDNFEQVVAAAPIVAELLANCQRLKILATSRATLHLYGEQEFPVLPLALPDSKRLALGETELATTLAQVAAVALFVQRAAAVKPDFALTPTNATTVAEICIGLDGLPLAIELAAAKLKLFSPPALLARLQQRLTLLTGGAHDLPVRQRTLRDEIAWSYDLLTASEQALFRRLAVFVGGFTLEAGQAVGDAAGGLGVAVLDGVGALVDHNLLKRVEQSDGEPCFGMLETIREYGLEQLETNGEAVAIRCQHLSFFLTLAEEADAKLRGSEQLTWLQRLEDDHANLQAALAWSLREQAQTDNYERQQGLHLAGRLHWFWNVRSYFNEGRHWSDRSLAMNDPSERGPAWARALQAAGVAAQMQGDFAYARRRLEESLALWRALENRWGIAYTLGWLAWVASVPCDLAAARPLAEASLTFFREMGDNWGIAFALNTLGNVVTKMGDHATARSLIEESVLRYRALGDTFGIADALAELSVLAYNQGDYEAARAGFEAIQAVLAGQHLVDDKFFRSVALDALANIARQQGDLQAASALFAEGLALSRDIGNQW